MRRIKRLCLSLFLIVAICLVANKVQAAVQNTNDVYWISYGIFNTTDGNVRYLMQIDSTGNILRAPKKVPNDFGPTISEAGANAINLWGNDQRVVINKKTLKMLKTVKTSIANPENVTNKAQQNFVVNASRGVDLNTPTLQFTGVSQTGVRNPANDWMISSRLISCLSAYFYCPGGVVSSDGRVILWLGYDLSFGPSRFSIQRLNSSGRPNGEEKSYAPAG